MISVDLRERAKTINHTLAARGQMIVTAESCTGGLISGALTDVPGSSEAVFGGYVTYDNRAKIEMIGVPAELIKKHGAVSAEVARAMAEGALRTANVDLAIAVTGIAGPGGDTEGKPVGLVHFGCATKAGTSVQERRFGDLGRQGIREATVEAALNMVLGCLGVERKPTWK